MHQKQSYSSTKTPRLILGGRFVAGKGGGSMREDRKKWGKGGEKPERIGPSQYLGRIDTNGQ